MIAATPLRANSRSICRYTTLLFPRLLNHLISADANPSRICTFHGTLSRALSAHTRTTPPTHFVSALTRTGGRYFASKAKCVDSNLSLTSRLVPIPPPHLPLRSFASLRLCESLLKLPLTLIRQNRKSILLKCKSLETQFRATRTFQRNWKFPGEGGVFVFKNR